ncbi:MAG TPA: hypothetical protein PK095_25370, partial [Myxococcota bacterium]|nr:hypothetical protein [Myxococcota bacterium]
MCSVDRMRRLEEARERFHAMALSSASLRCPGESYAEVFDLSRLLAEGARKGVSTIIASLGAAESKAVAVAKVGDGSAASEELGAIAHAVRNERIAAGDDDLAVGFPWIEGRIPDQAGGSVEIRAPLFLYPASLELASTKAGPVWSLAIAGAAWVNEPLTALFRRYTRVRITYEDFLAQDEDGLFKADDPTWQGFLKTLGRAGVTLADTAATLPESPERFAPMGSEELAKIPAGQFRLKYQVVLGRFPMLAAGIAADYDLTLHGVNPAVGVDSYALSGAGPLTELDYDDPGVYGRVPAPDGEDLGLLGSVRRWQIVPGDVWQDEALRALEVCKDGGLAITGAPGTGRSQVITNAVAAAMARGEKVLVTSTRRAALDDVIEHL